jgi:hypothetical protein
MQKHSLGSRPAAGWIEVYRFAAAAVVLALAACGGNGTESLPEAGMVQLTVTDRFGAAVPGAVVTGPKGESTTSAAGTAFVILPTPAASAEVTVTRETFVSQSKVVTSTPGRVNQELIVLDRVTSPAAASLASRSGAVATPAAGGRELTFEIELVVVDGAAQPIASLNAEHFTLLPCDPDPTDARADCIRGGQAADDVAYVPTTPAPVDWTLVPGAAARPFASALLLDQSGSIAETDPAGARLFASKLFVQALGDDDLILLGSFAGGRDARIPNAPLDVHAPFRNAAQAGGYFDTLDALASQVGGNTPLYASIDALRQQWLAGPPPAAGLGKAMVVFTDGQDTDCTSATDCVERRLRAIQAAVQDDVRIFTVGLTNQVDIAALGEIAHGTGGAMLYADNVTQLLPLYGSVGRLMSMSLPTHRLRWTVRSDADDTFRPGQTLIGRVQVDAGGSRFDVPFVVGIR